MDSIRKTEDVLDLRRSTNDLSWASRKWDGSSYFVSGQAKDSKEVVEAVLSSQTVQHVIREISERDGKSEATVRREAELILSEMAHDYHMYAIRWFGLILSKLSKRLYNSIQVNTEKLEDIKEAYKRYPVLLLPTHRSYVDFLLISYMSFHYSLPLPIIAAGMDFMAMAGMGEMLRKAGAFYIRRRFGGDSLYWALISEYVKTAVLKGGHPMEMFVEGTRSRTGKSLTPKIGLLSCVLELLTNPGENEIPDILILPISMSYDRTLEEQLYAHELLGKPKPKESTNLLLKALRFLGSQRYGSVYVNFGNLISARSILQSVSTSSPNIDSSFSRSVQQLATNVIVDHQQHVYVPIFAAVALIFVSKISRGTMRIEMDELICGVKSIHDLLLSRKSSLGFPLSGKGLDVNVHYVLRVHSALVTVQSHNNSLGVVVNFLPGDTVQHMVFQHYANQCLAILLPFCLYCLCNEAWLLLKPDASLTNDQWEAQIKITDNILEVYAFMRQLLREDFVYVTGTEQKEAMWAANLLKSSATRNKVSQNLLISGNFFQILRRGLEPYVISYWGVIKTLLEVERRNPQAQYEMSRLRKMCQEFIHQELKTQLNREYGALSLDTLANAISSLLNSEALSRVKQEDGSLLIVVKDIQKLSSILSHLEPLQSGCFAMDEGAINSAEPSTSSKSKTASLISAGAGGEMENADQLFKSKL